jgi:hypothetical protein
MYDQLFDFQKKLRIITKNEILFSATCFIQLHMSYAIKKSHMQLFLIIYIKKIKVLIYWNNNKYWFPHSSCVYTAALPYAICS